jgi:uncharacterized protein (TIGR03437 family)
VTVYGSGFTDQTVEAKDVPYPLGLADITVMVTDNSGAAAPAGLLYVSPGQINLQMPQSLSATGRATIAVLRAGTPAASGTIHVAAGGPAVFTLNGAGYGVPAAQIFRVKADGTQSYEAIAGAIELGEDRVFLVLYGTGIRGNVAVKVGDVSADAAFAPSPQFPGVDQVNVELPRPASGEVQVVVSCDGVAANSVTVVVR